ncbi:hypothetical protein B0T22DRAFT_448463 [Podospora appendiculata]|uniref:Secreted protein n=1 Tax=Podospora appendiculata TaxID=314037 RepID=A0AAE0XGF2_9PEZI|nr:hypothetical protein B0T22DRAFT_448463 [Podospora appendiculata]
MSTFLSFFFSLMVSHCLLRYVSSLFSNSFRSRLYVPGIPSPSLFWVCCGSILAAQSLSGFARELCSIVKPTAPTGLSRCFTLDVLLPKKTCSQIVPGSSTSSHDSYYPVIDGQMQP